MGRSYDNNKGSGQLIQNLSNNQTSYLTHSNYVAQSQGVNDVSSYNTNISQMYQHPVLPSMPAILQNPSQQNSLLQEFKPACSEAEGKSETGEVISSQRTQDGYGKMSKESRNAHNRQNALNLRSGSSQAPATSGQPTSSYRGNGTETRRTAEEYEAQILQFEELAAQYEKEMNELRQSNDE